ncbi:MAG: hypothetical protein Q7R56_01380 [Nanoarchaeota archaeon]|nr:hypothetical protein [Nanoarchaeota archaeon]
METLSLQQLQTTLQPLQEQINTIKKTKEAAYQKKEQLKQEIRTIIQEIKKIQTEQAKLSTGLKEAREERNKHREETKHLREEINQLREQKKTLLTKKTYKGNIHELQHKIERLEMSIETEGYDYTKEQKVMAEIKKLKPVYQQLKTISTINQHLREEVTALHDHGDKEHVYASIARALQGNKQQHERFVQLIIRLKTLKKEQAQAFATFFKEKEAYQTLLPQYKVLIEQLNRAQQQQRQEQDAQRVVVTHNREQKKQQQLQERVKTVEEKWKKSKKLTTEDLIALQGTR